MAAAASFLAAPATGQTTIQGWEITQEGGLCRASFNRLTTIGHMTMVGLGTAPEGGQFTRILFASTAMRDLSDEQVARMSLMSAEASGSLSRIFGVDFNVRRSDPLDFLMAESDHTLIEGVAKAAYLVVTWPKADGDFGRMELDIRGDENDAGKAMAALQGCAAGLGQ